MRQRFAVSDVEYPGLRLARVCNPTNVGFRAGWRHVFLDEVLERYNDAVAALFLGDVSRFFQIQFHSRSLLNEWSTRRSDALRSSAGIRRDVRAGKSTVRPA